jgi:hypothetical protein
LKKRKSDAVVASQVDLIVGALDAQHVEEHVVRVDCGGEVNWIPGNEKETPRERKKR